MHGYRARIAIPFVVPDAFEELFTRKHRARVPREELEEVEFARREVYLAAANLHRARPRVDHDVAADDAATGVRRGVVIAAAKHCLHARHEFAGAEGLGEVVIGAHLEARDAVHLVAPRGEHDDGCARLFADAAADFHAPKLRQHQVQDDEVRPRLRVRLERRLAVARREHGVAFTLEVALNHLDNDGFIFHDKDARAFHRPIVRVLEYGRCERAVKKVSECPDRSNRPPEGVASATSYCRSQHGGWRSQEVTH